MLRSRGVRLFSHSRSLAVDYTHAVVGGGVVGMAIASELSKRSSNRVVLLEKNADLGQETTSRNSEVIHAGLYYPEDSLKMSLCIEGKSLLYSEARAAGVEMRQCGKWVVAQNEDEAQYLDKVHDRSKALGIPVEFIPLSQAKELEPHIRARAAVLNSSSTGIVSAHSLLSFLESEFQDNGGDTAVGSEVIGIEYNQSTQEYAVTVEAEGIHSSIEVNNVINSAGLYACHVSNLLLPESRHFEPYYAKGNYVTYTKSTPKINRLVYPCPTKNVQSLGTHLTIDLGGQIKFGPDLEWVDFPENYSVSTNRLDLILNDVQTYFPSVELEHLSPSYCGIRPKLAGKDSKTFADFVIREEQGYKGFVNCLGIESPGLTASMAIGKYVARLV